MNNNLKIKIMAKSSFLNKIKSLSKAAWLWIVNLWSRTNELADKVCPVAIKVVDGLKTVNESTEGDAVAAVIKAVIPGVKDDIIIDSVRSFLKNVLPKVAVELKIVDSIRNITDPSEQLKAICNAINVSSDEFKNSTYHALATMVINYLSDGKITWGEAVALAEYYYQNQKAFTK